MGPGEGMGWPSICNLSRVPVASRANGDRVTESISCGYLLYSSTESLSPVPTSNTNTSREASDEAARYAPFDNRGPGSLNERGLETVTLFVDRFHSSSWASL